MIKTAKKFVLCVTFVMLSGFVSAQQPSNHPVERSDENSKLAHQQLLNKARQGTIDVYFVGDSITRRWGATDYPQFLEHWNKCFYGWNAANFGWGGDTTQNILWRLDNGELDGLKPKVFVVLAGTNNINRRTRVEDARDIADGIKSIVGRVHKAAPNSTVLLIAVFPREDIAGANDVIEAINAELMTFADGMSVRFVNLNDQLLDADKKLRPGFFPDKLHPSLEVYELWAKAISPMIEGVLGPKSETDNAPAPTGDPKAKK